MVAQLRLEFLDHAQRVLSRSRSSEDSFSGSSRLSAGRPASCCSSPCSSRSCIRKDSASPTSSASSASSRSSSTSRRRLLRAVVAHAVFQRQRADAVHQREDAAFFRSSVVRPSRAWVCRWENRPNGVSNCSMARAKREKKPASSRSTACSSSRARSSSSLSPQTASASTKMASRINASPLGWCTHWWKRSRSSAPLKRQPGRLSMMPPGQGG